ncbi:MAG: glycosyltransferase [Chloroflexi bacterium]|nr:glycosyltransferase [Chloroflexota bacterium]
MATSIVNNGPARILIVTNLISPLTCERAVVGRAGGYSLYWYSLPCYPLAGVDGYDGPPALRSRLFQHLLSPFYLKRALMRFKPDLIHVHWGLQRLLNPLLTRFHPLVVTVMAGEILPDQVYRGINRFFVDQLLDAADIITSKSAFTDEALNRIGPYAAKIRRITWGIDLDKFQPGLEVSHLRRQWQLQPDDFVFFSARNCRPLYNKHLIVQAFTECLQQTGYCNIKLLISEARPEPLYHQSLKKMIRQLQIEEYVRFVGEISHQEMPLYYNLADVVISVPSSDGMPQSLYESMACGTFHILGDLPSYYELVESQHTGYLVPLNNPTVLAEAMLWSMKHPEQLTTAAALGRAKMTEIANKSDQVRRMNEIYAELLATYRKV